MSREVSPATGRSYGVKRVCALWEVPRSTVYFRRKQTELASPDHPAPRKRGPKTEIADPELLARIRAYLKGSPFAGEDHRKVCAHLKIVTGIRTSRTRILRLMRENGLLSPYRHTASASPHDGTIITSGPQPRVGHGWFPGPNR